MIIIDRNLGKTNDGNDLFSTISMADTKHHTLGNLCPFWCQIPQKVFKLVSLSVGKKKTKNTQ